MKNTFKTMSFVSILALTVPTFGYAADMSATSTTGTPMVPKPGTVTRSTSAQSSMNDIKVFFAGLNENPSLDPILIRRDMTAHGLIGEPVMNQANQKIATINDIILDKSGNAILVIVSDKGFLGIGNKLAAFDYKNVISQNQDGDVTMALTQNMIDRASDFSYDRRDWAKAKIIPADSISTNALMSGSLYDNMDKKLAGIENIYFRSGEASQIIVGFNKTLGMGGNLATLDFEDLQVVKKTDRVDLKLSSKQADLFRNFEKSVSN